jgi:CPA1 family monovalent cation:H+ antiporter
VHASHSTEALIVALLVAVAALIVAAQRSRIPYPIFLVFGGLLLGAVPGLPNIELAPQLVLLIVLPPLLYSAAFFSNLRELRAKARPIGLLAIGLVLATTLSVAAVAHAALGLPWPSAFVLGAVVAPTDPTAATAIAGRLAVPRRLVTLIEGESLVNDSTALIAYKFAIAAVLSGSFSLVDAAGSFVKGAAGGVLIGLVVGKVVAEVRRRTEDPPTEMVLSLLTAYFAYLPAEALGVSGVLAAVTTGIYLGWRAPTLVTPSTRLQLFGVWEVLVFILNAALFILIGLQLPNVLDGLRNESVSAAVGDAALVAATVIVTRIVWVFPFTYGPRRLSRRVRERDPSPDWRTLTLLAWTGMRGAVSLAAALAIPVQTEAGAPFPGRDLIVFCAFGVIITTLCLQGLSLPPLIRALGVKDDGKGEREETKARIAAAEAALRRVDELREEDWVRDDTADRLRGMLDYRRRRFAARFDDDDDGGYEERSTHYQRLQREILEAQRAAVVELRNAGRINDETMRRVQRDLDLEDSRLEI